MNRRAKISLENKPVRDVVLMKGVTSGEYFHYQGQAPRHVFENVDILIHKGEVWGICGNELFTVKLFLEIMANVKPYFVGRCALCEIGMMRQKRVILPHVFYIGTSEMVYQNMNVLEFLMFATAKSGIGALERQERIFQFLIDCGLGYISLSPIKMLAREERSVVALLVADYSESQLVVMNLPQYEYDERLMSAIARIGKHIGDAGRTLVIGTMSCEMIERACSDAAFFHNGKIAYRGTVDEFKLTHDKINCYIQDQDIRSLRERMAPCFKEHQLVEISENLLAIRDNPKGGNDAQSIYRKLAEANVAPEKVSINAKTVRNAYEEMARAYDLQE